MRSIRPPDTTTSTRARSSAPLSAIATSGSTNVPVTVRRIESRDFTVGIQPSRPRSRNAVLSRIGRASAVASLDPVGADGRVADTLGDAQQPLNISSFRACRNSSKLMSGNPSAACSSAAVVIIMILRS
jgi:hypothetical protein